MPLTFGFYNSINHDRRYNADQMSAIFSQVLNDGIFANYGEHFAVSPTSGMGIKVSSGRAWFNGTWTFNDSYHYLTVGESEVALDRIDTVAIEIDKNNRKNDIKIVSGVPSLNPIAPILQNGDGVYQHAVAYIYVPAQTYTITASMITNIAGTSASPFVTSILQSTDISALWQNWGAEFNEWFEALQNELDEHQAAHLQNQINHMKVLTGISDPNLQTEGELGQFYLNTVTYMLFRCADANGGNYFWVPMSTRTINGEPTNTTAGFVGEFCMDLTTHYMYKCISSNTYTGTYEWEPIGDHHVGDVIFTARTDLGPKYAYVQNGSSISVDKSLCPDFEELKMSSSIAKLTKNIVSSDNYMTLPFWELDGIYGTHKVESVYHSGHNYTVKITLKLTDKILKIDSSGFNFELGSASDYIEVILDDFEVPYNMGSWDNSTYMLTPVVKFNGIYYCLFVFLFSTSPSVRCGRLYSATSITGPWNLVTNGPLSNPVRFNMGSLTSNTNFAILRVIGDRLCVVPSVRLGFCYPSGSLYEFSDLTSAPVAISGATSMVSYLNDKYIYYSGVNSADCYYGNTLETMTKHSGINTSGYTFKSPIFYVNGGYYVFGSKTEYDGEYITRYDVLYTTDAFNGPWSVCMLGAGSSNPLSYNIPYIDNRYIIDNVLYLWTCDGNVPSYLAKLYKGIFSGGNIFFSVVADSVINDYMVADPSAAPMFMQIGSDVLCLYKTGLYNNENDSYMEGISYGCARHNGGAIANVPIPYASYNGALPMTCRYIRVLK